jgi:hypothetical protein
MFAAMKTADFDYDLPRESIAQHPAVPRDSARLLEIRPDRLIDRTVRDLPQCLAAGDVMVVNDTRVIPARIEGTRGPKAAGSGAPSRGRRGVSGRVTALRSVPGSRPRCKPATAAR